MTCTVGGPTECSVSGVKDQTSRKLLLLLLMLRLSAPFDLLPQLLGSCLREYPQTIPFWPSTLIPFLRRFEQVGVSSEGFARLAAAVFVSRGFKVYFLGGTVPTPLVAFGVSHLKACAGVMVTASHNPKMDNGYKVSFFPSFFSSCTKDNNLPKLCPVGCNRQSWGFDWHTIIIHSKFCT